MSEPILVRLEQIRTNPWQTRRDYGDIEQLAGQIASALDAWPATLGLMQVPAGRLMTPDSEPVDLATVDSVSTYLESHPGASIHLAFGHRRFWAFSHLHDSGAEAYAAGVMPILVQPLSDADMIDAVWAENADRKQTSPIEDATLMQLASEQLGLSQQEIAQRWGLGRSTVANKLRLLQLPAKVQEHVRKGEISERQALALKTMYDWPDQVQDLVGGAGGYLSMALDGMTADDLRARLNSQLDYRTELIDSLPHKDVELRGQGIEAITCAVCTVNLNGKRCYKQGCRLARDDAYVAHQAEAAAAEHGVAVVDFKDLGHAERGVFAYSRLADDALKTAEANECPNRVLFSRAHGNWVSGAPTLNGYPNIHIGCSFGRDCTCMAKARQADDDEPEELSKADIRRKERAAAWDPVLEAARAQLVDQFVSAISETGWRAMSYEFYGVEVEHTAHQNAQALAWRITSAIDGRRGLWRLVDKDELVDAREALIAGLVDDGWEIDASRIPLPRMAYVFAQTAQEGA